MTGRHIRNTMRPMRRLPALLALLAVLAHALPGWAGLFEPGLDNAETISLGDEPGSTVLHHMAEQSGDLDAIRQRGVLRILVDYDMVGFFLVNGQPAGLEHSLGKAFEGWLNRSRKHGEIPLRVVFVPVPFARIFTALREGKGDIAAAGITVTPERERAVAFCRPYREDVEEVVVAAPNATLPGSVEDLAGRAVRVLPGTSHAEHVDALNAHLAARGLPPVRAKVASAWNQAHDLLRLVDAGLIDYAVADRHVAELYAAMLPRMRIAREAALHRGGRLAWAVRPGDEALRAEVDAFLAARGRAALQEAERDLAAFHGRTRRFADSLEGLSLPRLAQVREPFTRYARLYDMNWVLALSQGYQESRLDQAAVSPMGAVGVMQVLPETAAEYGFAHVRTLAAENIQAGLCYLNRLRGRYFDDPSIPHEQRIFFALAAYNAGPNRVQKLRQVAAGMGLDPNLWFGNVEYAALRKIGPETVAYVADIAARFLAFQTFIDVISRPSVPPTAG